MKKLIVFVIFIIFSSQAHAISATTNDGHAACFKKEWLDDVVNFIIAKDMGSFQAYLDSKKCIILKKGLRVTVTESPGMFGSKAGFVFNGVKLWTVREGLSYGS